LILCKKDVLEEGLKFDQKLAWEFFFLLDQELTKEGEPGPKVTITPHPFDPLNQN